MRNLTEIGDWFDTTVSAMAVKSGARSISRADVIPPDVLERCDYFESFPGVAVPAGAGAFLPPAACYQIYPSLRGARLEAPCLVTIVATCGRNERGADELPGRLRTFRMREIVFIGPSAWVSERRHEWMSRTLEFARSQGLDGSLEPATDTFFGGAGRGRRLLQQLKGLKYELRMNVDGTVMAVSSFNLHESFFSSRFDISMADGTPCASGCAAFGLERWALAFRARHRHASLR